MRQSQIKRITKETSIEMSLCLEGTGQAQVDTGIGFMDHMFELLAFHSGIDCIVKCQGDLKVDSHHTVEDLGIVFAYDDAVRPTRLAMNMEKYLETALKRLSEKAQEKGANAVLGICFDLRDTLKPMLMGTAVILEDESS